MKNVWYNSRKMQYNRRIELYAYPIKERCMPMKSKLFAIFFLLIFMIGLLVPVAAQASTPVITSVTNVTVRPEIMTVGEFSRYQISFISNETLTGGIDTIQIRFPSEYRFGHASWLSGGYVDIKGQPSGGNNYENGLLIVLVPRNTTIHPGETVVVNLHSGIMRNPDRAGEYSFSINTSKETTPVPSPRFAISEFVSQDGVSRPHVETKPVRGYQNEEISIRFTTNQNGQLIGGVDQILLEFPSGFRFPQNIDEKTITINGIQMHSLAPVVVGARLILPLSPTMNFPENHEVQVVIGVSAGITLSRDISDARLTVSTTKNTATVESFSFDMRRTPDQLYIPADDMNPGVTVMPNGAGALSQWTFDFPRNSILMMEGELVMGFTLWFPNGTVLPGAIATQHITVNTLPISGVLVNAARREVIFTMPIGFSVRGDITINIAAAAGIQNPQTAVYLMEILPLRGTRTLTTKQFEIKSVSDPITMPVEDATPVTPEADKVVKVTLNDPVAVKDDLAVVLDVAPQLIDGFTMVPLRFVSEGLGAGVEYDSTQNTVTLTLGSRDIVLWPGSTLAKVDNIVVTLAKAPLIRNDRTMVPVRFVSECFGAKVDYISAIDPITITMTADALTKMPTVPEIQAAQTGAASGVGSGGTATDPGTGTDTPDGDGQTGSGSTGTDPGTGVVGRTITLGAGRTNANLRSGPGTTYDLVGLILPSETATIIEVSTAADGEWYHLEFGYMKAWIRADLVDVQ